MVVDRGTVEREEVQPSCAVRVLQIRREHELQDVVDRHLRLYVLELWRLLWNRK